MNNKHFFNNTIRENFRRYLYKFIRNKLSIIGFISVLISIFIAIFAPLIAPYPQHVKAFCDFSNASMSPSSAYFFGTDPVGRDIFTRIIFSFRGALLASIIVIAVSGTVGITLGLIAGYHNGSLIEIIIMRATDIFLSLPKLVLVLAIAAVMEPSFINSIIALSYLWWASYARLVFNMTTAIKEEYYVKSAELIGASKIHILFSEILPNCLSPIATKMALDAGWVIMITATLSFVGLGEQPPIPSFGQLVAEGSRYMPELWWMTIFPACGIVFIILGFNLLGDGIRDMLDQGRQ